jgi:hypothetical protein
MLPTITEKTGMHNRVHLFSIEMRSHKLFLPGLAWNCDPPNLNLLHSLR